MPTVELTRRRHTSPDEKGNIGEVVRLMELYRLDAQQVIIFDTGIWQVEEDAGEPRLPKEIVWMQIGESRKMAKHVLASLSDSL